MALTVVACAPLTAQTPLKREVDGLVRYFRDTANFSRLAQDNPDAVLKIAQTGWAVPVRVGRKIGVFYDHARTPVQFIGEDEPLAGKIRAGQQQLLGTGIFHQLHAVGFVGQETVATGLEEKSLPFHRSHGPSGNPIGIENQEFPVR